MTMGAAMQAIDSMLKDFKYLYQRTHINIPTLHLTFTMDSPYSLQMSIKYQERWCDILCFISPTALDIESPYYREVLEVVTYINYNIKSWGRFYIDECGDIPYSLRLHYNVLEAVPGHCKNEIESAVDFYTDVFLLLINTCTGRVGATEAIQSIKEMWGR